VSATHLPVWSLLANALAAGDVDGDGDLDLLIARTGQDALWHNDGTGRFTEAAGALPADGDDSLAVALADLDGDGDLDLALGNHGPARLLRNDGGGTFTPAPSTPPDRTARTPAVLLRDVDGDGDVDAFLAGADTRSALWLNDGAGAFVDATSPPWPESHTVVAVADLDADGDPDLLAAANGALWLLRGSGGGAFLPPAPTPLTTPGTDALTTALGDVDGDGDPDVLVGANGTNPRLLENRGGGVFADVTSTRLQAGNRGTTAVVLTDLDGDGDLDGVLGNSRDWSMLLTNDGAGTFTLETVGIDTAQEDVGAVLAHDFDGDGDTDLVFACADATGAGSSKLARRTGPGWQTTFLPIGPRTAAGDVDGDGDVDLLSGGAPAWWHGVWSSRDLLLQNAGDGTFADASAQIPQQSPDGTGAVVLADLDGDGDLDAWLTRYGTYGNHANDRLLWNDGSGTFALAGTDAVPVAPRLGGSALAADVDGDGDLDVVLPSNHRLVANLRPQLAWRALPRVGQPLDFTVHGPAGGVFLHAGSLGRVDVPFVGLGRLRVDPATLAVVAVGNLDAHGRAATVVQVPHSQALVGVTLPWQALVGFPIVFTNLEPTTLTGF
jgi:hypothetical protein